MEECCPKFEPRPWDNKTLAWKNRKFVKTSVFTLFYMPFGFGSAVAKLMKKIESAGAKCEDYLMLSEHTSPWNMDLFIAVDKEVPGAENFMLSGKFFSKVYEGEFKESGKWMQDFTKYAEGKGMIIRKRYVWYTTCPKCAKKYGKNYVVIFGKID